MAPLNPVYKSNHFATSLGADNIAAIANTFTIISAAAADEIILPTTNIEKFALQQ
ncbi:hypothetical protein ACVXZY_01725 [Staphylococcus aureus]